MGKRACLPIWPQPQRRVTRATGTGRPQGSCVDAGCRVPRGQPEGARDGEDEGDGEALDGELALGSDDGDWLGVGAAVADADGERDALGVGAGTVTFVLCGAGLTLGATAWPLTRVGGDDASCGVRTPTRTEPEAGAVNAAAGADAACDGLAWRGALTPLAVGMTPGTRTGCSGPTTRPAT